MAVHSQKDFSIAIQYMCTYICFMHVYEAKVQDQYYSKCTHLLINNNSILITTNEPGPIIINPIFFRWGKWDTGRWSAQPKSASASSVKLASGESGSRTRALFHYIGRPPSIGLTLCKACLSKALFYSPPFHFFKYWSWSPNRWVITTTH